MLLSRSVVIESDSTTIDTATGIPIQVGSRDARRHYSKSGKKLNETLVTQQNKMVVERTFPG
jgi:hypothetical protein